MDRENRKFYDGEDEEQKGREDAQGETMSADDEENDIRYCSDLLKGLRTAIKSGTNVPLTTKKIVDSEELLAILDELEQNLPDAIQYGMRMYIERDRVLGTAQQSATDCVTTAEMRARQTLDDAHNEAEQTIIEAENEASAIIADAQERADHMVEESEILRVAQEEARKIRSDAHVEANETRLRANHAAFSLLSSVEQELSEMLKAVRRQRMDIGDNNE